MTRVKGGPAARAKHKKIIASTKGQRGTKSKLFGRANEARLKSLSYATRDRRNRKRDMRRLWIVRINAAARQNGMTYSQFVNGLRLAGVDINRKMLADMAVRDEVAFAAIVETARQAQAAEA